ncbi:MAG: helix-turn-helix transcriptional regulator [Nostocaceae cyanobacterium]|nr:helix-turn-helix transcriptional regulator [Nostocaceae cyanobacterium]
MHSEILRSLREEAGLTQEELAVRIKVAVSTLRRWETQGMEPSMTVLQIREFCKAVGKSFDDLPDYLSQR